MATKFCRDCDGYRPTSDFTKNARSRDGLAFYCRDHLAARSLRSREARRTHPRVRREPPPGLVVSDGDKWCPDCNGVLPLTEFVRTVQSASGYSSYCKPCHNKRSRASRERAGGSRTYHLTRRYGMTAAEADHLLEKQQGLCAICKSAAAAHVDHDHTTGADRALLCFNCNGGLGQFKDDPLVLHAAAYYVTFHRVRQEAAAGTPSSGASAAGRPGSPPAETERRPAGRRTDRGRRAAPLPDQER
jgi:hypothetical protein